MFLVLLVGLVAVGLAAIGWTSTTRDLVRLRGHLLGLGDDFVEGERTAGGATAGLALIGVVKREALGEGVKGGGYVARRERGGDLGCKAGEEVEGDALEECDGLSVVFEFRAKVR